MSRWTEAATEANEECIADSDLKHWADHQEEEQKKQEKPWWYHLNDDDEAIQKFVEEFTKCQ